MAPDEGQDKFERSNHSGGVLEKRKSTFVRRATVGNVADSVTYRLTDMQRPSLAFR